MIIYVAHALHSKTATYYLQRSFAALQNAFTLRVHLKARPGTIGVPEESELTLTKARPFCLRNESLCPVTAARVRAGAHAAAVSDGGSPERDCLCGLQSAATGCGTQSQPPPVSVTTSTWLNAWATPSRQTRHASRTSARSTALRSPRHHPSLCACPCGSRCWDPRWAGSVYFTSATPRRWPGRTTSAGKVGSVAVRYSHAFAHSLCAPNGRSNWICLCYTDDHGELLDTVIDAAPTGAGDWSR